MRGRQGARLKVTLRREGEAEDLVAVATDRGFVGSTLVVKLLRLGGIDNNGLAEVWPPVLAPHAAHAQQHVRAWRQRAVVALRLAVGARAVADNLLHHCQGGRRRQDAGEACQEPLVGNQFNRCERATVGQLGRPP